MKEFSRRCVLGEFGKLAALLALPAAASCSGSSPDAPSFASSTARTFTLNDLDGTDLRFFPPMGTIRPYEVVVVTDGNNRTLRLYEVRTNNVHIYGYDLDNEYLLDFQLPANCPNDTTIQLRPQSGAIGTLTDLRSAQRERTQLQAVNSEASQLIARASVEIPYAKTGLAAASRLIPDGRPGNGCAVPFHMFLQPGRAPQLQTAMLIGETAAGFFQSDFMTLHVYWRQNDVQIEAAFLSGNGPLNRVNVFPIGTDRLDFNSLRERIYARGLRGLPMETMATLSANQQKVVAEAYAAAICVAMDALNNDIRGKLRSNWQRALVSFIHRNQFSRSNVPDEFKRDPFWRMRQDNVLRQYVPMPENANFVPNPAPQTPPPRLQGGTGPQQRPQRVEPPPIAQPPAQRATPTPAVPWRGNLPGWPDPGRPRPT